MVSRWVGLLLLLLLPAGRCVGAARAAARHRSVSNGYRPWDGIQELLLLLLLPLLLLLLLLHLLLLQLLLAAAAAAAGC